MQLSKSETYLECYVSIYDLNRGFFKLQLMLLTFAEMHEAHREGFDKGIKKIIEHFAK